MLTKRLIKLPAQNVQPPEMDHNNDAAIFSIPGIVAIDGSLWCDPPMLPILPAKCTYRVALSTGLMND